MTAPSVLGSLYAKANVKYKSTACMQTSSDILHEDSGNIVFERLVEFAKAYIKIYLPLMTRSRRLLILASAFSLTYGATISRSDVYYLIMKRPFTESSNIFKTSSEMNYF